MALFGHSADECAQRLTPLCQNPTADTKPDVVCPAGSVVDQAKAQQCLTKVMTATCAELDEQGSTTICEQVCGAAAPADGGTSPGNGNGNGNGSMDGSSTADAQSGDAAGAKGPTPEKAAFCRSMFPRLCKRTFECIAPADRDASFTSAYGASEAECVARKTALCDSYLNGCVFNPASAQQCLQGLPTVMCQVLDLAGMPTILPPAICLGTCPPSIGM